MSLFRKFFEIHSSRNSIIEGEKDFVGRAPSAADGDGGVGMEDGSAASELRPDRAARCIEVLILKFFKRGSVTTGVMSTRSRPF